MGRKRCKSCFALIGLCLVTCRAQSDAHDHSSDHTDHAHDEPANASDFVSWLGSESPASHIQHIYSDSGVSTGIFPWILDAARQGACTPVSITEARAHDPEAGHDTHDDHSESETGHDGHAHRRLLELSPPPETPSPDEHNASEDGAHEDHEHDDHSDENDEDSQPLGTARVLTVESLEELEATVGTGPDAVTQALAYITTCLIDPQCVLGGAAARTAPVAEIGVDAHDPAGHAGHGRGGNGASEYIGLKIGLAAAFLAMTIVTSYLPLAFMWSPHYNGILTCLNVFSGSVFLSVGIMHLLPHVADYEASADLPTDFPVGNAFVIIGFLLVLFMEQVVFDVHGDVADQRSANVNTAAKYTVLTQATTVARRYHSPLLTEAAVVLHAVLECIVLGLAGSKTDLWLLFSAICSHKIFTTMSQSARFLRLGCPPALLFILLAPFHLLPPLGVVLGALTGGENATASLVLAGLATGTFLYVGAFEVIAEEFAESATSQVMDTADGWSCWANGCLGGGSNSGCVGDPVSGEQKESDGGGAKSWMPSRVVKFVVFVLGCGVIFAVTSALPAHSEIHNH